MRRDPRVFVFGEDVGLYGGAYAATRGLLQEFGKERVIDTAISANPSGTGHFSFSNCLNSIDCPRLRRRALCRARSNSVILLSKE
jgi:hypothetical protein